MAIVHPDLSSARERSAAGLVIQGLRRLLKMRYTHAVSRAEFLQRWQDMRVLLKLTPEYQTMLRIVFARDKVCVTCGGVATDPHHKVPVAWAPHRACDPSNVEAVCRKCHDARHSPPLHTLHSAPRGRPPHTAPSLRTLTSRAVGTHPSTLRRDDV